MSVRHLVAAGLALGVSLSIAPAPVTSTPPPVYPPGVSVVTVVADKQFYAIGETAIVSALACDAGATVVFTFVLSTGEVIVLTSVVEGEGETSIATVFLLIEHLADFTAFAECNGKSAATTFVTFELPVTGGSVERPLVVAVLLFVTGLGLLLVARTRRHTIAP